MKRKTVIKEVFTERLKYLMDYNNETTYSLAEQVSLTSPTISRYITGQMAAKITTIEAMAKYFKVNPLWLMGHDVPKEITSSQKNIKQNDVLFEITPRSLEYSPEIAKTIISQIKSTFETYIQYPEILDILNSESCFEEKSMILNSYISYVVYAPIENHINIYFDADYKDKPSKSNTPHQGDNKSQELLHCFDQLNEAGKHRAIENVKDLTRIDMYRKKMEESHE